MSPAEQWVADQWERVAPILARAIAKSAETFDADYVWREISEGRAQLWPMPNSAVVTSIHTSPTGLRFIKCWLAAGKLDELRAIKPTIENFARQQGCTRSVWACRPGFGKAFPDYSLHSVLLSKDL